MNSVSLDDLSSLDLFILYTLNKSESGIPSETHYQKIMFQAVKILGKNPEDFGYAPHTHGPYSHMMSEEKNSLLMLGYLNDDNGSIIINTFEMEMISKIDPSVFNASFKLELMVEKLCSFTSDELLLMTYCDDLAETNGMFIENSSVKEHILRERIPIAVGMYKSKKVSLCRAAELAGLSVRQFETEVF